MVDEFCYCHFKMNGWGGKRKGSGRRKRFANLHDVPHCKRPALAGAWYPVHVVLRVGSWRDRIRNRDGYAAIRNVVAKLYGDLSFRVCHVSIQHNHIHLLVEATDEQTLSKGMQRFAIRTAKAINAKEGLVGRLFAHRYHATQITTTSHARHALSYVLNNWRRHREDRRKEGVPIDKYSSGFTFDGWRGSPDLELYAELEPLPVSKPTTWLLATGWRAHGEIDVYERPGPRQ